MALDLTCSNPTRVQYIRVYSKVGWSLCVGNSASVVKFVTLHCVTCCVIIGRSRWLFLPPVAMGTCLARCSGTVGLANWYTDGRRRVANAELWNIITITLYETQCGALSTLLWWYYTIIIREYKSGCLSESRGQVRRRSSLHGWCCRSVFQWDNCLVLISCILCCHIKEKRVFLYLFAVAYLMGLWQL